MNKKLIALVMTGAMAVTPIIPAMAQEAKEVNKVISTAEEVKAPASSLYYGRVKEIMKDENGKITALVMDSDRYGKYVMNISDSTVWIDNGRETALDPQTIKADDGLYIYHSNAVTSSLPPKTTAFAVVGALPMDKGAGTYVQVEKSEKKDDGTFVITTDNGEITADKDTKVNPYLTKNMVRAEDIKEGSRLMVWQKVDMRGSNTGKAHSIMILPEIKDEAQAELGEGDEISIIADGKTMDVKGRFENGTVMIPVAVVARSMGYEAIYNETEKGQVVTIESDTFKVTLNIGKENIFGQTKIPNTVGMTAPMNYGKAPYIVAPGTTWAPAQLFEIHQMDVKVEGSTVSISKRK